MIKKVVIGLLILCLATKVSAQYDQSIHLYFMDKSTYDPIEKVHISSKDMSFNVFSDKSGKAAIPQNINVDTFIITSELYQQIIISKIALFNGPNKIYLSSQYFEEDPIIIISKSNSKKSNESGQSDQLKSKYIQFSSSASTADLLANTGKMHVQKSQQGGGSPVIRGFEANKILLVVDGIRMNNSIYRSGHLQNIITIDPLLLGEIEVHHGSGSTLYGSDALGGVIYMKSKEIKTDTSQKGKFSGNIVIKSGSAAKETMIGGNLFYAAKKWGTYTSFSTQTLDDLKAGKNKTLYPGEWGDNQYYIYRQKDRDTFIRNREPHIQNHSGFSQVNVAQKIMFAPNLSNKHIINFQYSNSTNVPRYDRMNMVTNNFPKYAKWYYGPQKRLLAAYTYKKKSKSKIFNSLESIVAFQDIEESRHTRRYQKDTLNSRIEKVKIYSYNLNLYKKYKKSKFSYGLESIVNTIESEAYTTNILTNKTGNLDTRYPDGDNYTFNSGMFFQHQYIPNKNWVLKQGIRLSYNYLHSEFVDTSFFNFPIKTIDNHNVAPSIDLGFVYKPSKTMKHYISLSTAYRTPNLDDIAKVFDTKDQFVIIPNAKLKPENTYNIEYGFTKKIKNRFKTELVVFHTIYNNAIVVGNFNYLGQDSIMYNGALSNVAAAQNAKNAFIQGANWSIKFIINKNLYLSNTLNFTYGRIKTDSNLIPLDHIPPIGGKAIIGTKQKGFKGELSINYSGAKTLENYNPNGEDNLNFAPINGNGLPSWYRIDFTSSYALFPYLVFYVGVENILDFHYRTYASGISAPGRNFKLSAVVKF